MKARWRWERSSEPAELRCRVALLLVLLPSDKTLTHFYTCKRNQGVSERDVIHGLNNYKDTKP